MELWTAFLLGLVGSLHCAGMCGPIAIAQPVTGNTTAAFVAGRAAYNGGRVMTYVVLGALFGVIGSSFALFGFQRWVSLIAGIAILVVLLASWRHRANVHISRGVALLKSHLGKLLRRTGFGATFLLGNLNGLLPCGLVYAACAGAAASGSAVQGMNYMFAFGLGTVPMMLAVGLAGKKLQFTLRFRFEKLIPICLVFVALLLIVRGLALGIPYLSPDVDGSCCPR
ncbi:MAG: sulfite exporter TauE/SafE family protein [Verrucomicrobia bacterium]|nr:sulfite exporter TauE/SafE family protein [Verrucomicrobiota bacterium]